MIVRPRQLGQPAQRPRSRVAAHAPGAGGAVLLVATRFALWVGVQLLVAGLLVAVGTTTAGRSLNAAAAWWMLYAGSSTWAPSPSSPG